MDIDNDKKRMATLLISGGVLLVTLPLLLKEYFFIPDFFRGLLAGIGIGLELTGLFIMLKNKKSVGQR